MKDPNQDPAVKKLFYNRDVVSEWLGEKIKHSPPSSNAEHYPHKYKWDILFAVIIKGRRGFAEDAAAELEDLFAGQRPDGLLPSPQFLEKGRERDLERAFFEDPNASDYGQPLLEAQASVEVYEGLKRQGLIEEAGGFLRQILPKLEASYDFFDRERTGSYGRLVFNTHPHETGRDSDPIFDFYKLRIPRFGKNTPWAINAANRVLDYGSIILRGVEHWLDNWEISKTRQRFEVYDVMFNCIYYDNLLEMAKLVKLAAESSENNERYRLYLEKSERYEQLAKEVEERIKTDAWFEDKGPDGLFLGLEPDGPIDEVSISNLFPLLLENLEENQLESLLDLLENYFITEDVKLPIPSVPPIDPFTGRPNRNYDPYHAEWDRLWRGSVWMNMNWYLVERGLDRQAQRANLAHRTDLIARCQLLIQLISELSYKVVEGIGPWEMYGPEDARAQRTRRSPNFAWSNLVYELKDKYLLKID